MFGFRLSDNPAHVTIPKLKGGRDDTDVCRSKGQAWLQRQGTRCILGSPSGMASVPGYVKGRGTAALEVVWRNESEEKGVWEGFLWSGIGNLPEHKIAYPHNYLVLSADDRPQASTSDHPAFLAALFSSADATGRGDIHVYTMDATTWMLDRWRSAFAAYADRLHSPVNWHGDVDSIPLTYGFFGPPSEVQEAWQTQPFPLSKDALRAMCTDALQSEQLNAQMVHPPPVDN